VIIGVNKSTEDGEQPISVAQIDATAEQRQIERLDAVKRRRSASEVERALGALRKAAEGIENTMPYILDAVRAYATVGEICGILRDVFGGYTETSVV